MGSATASTSAANFAQVVTATENRSMGGYRLTSLGTGTATADAVNLSQMNAAIAAAGIPASSGAVLISLSDTTPGYLGVKVVGTGAVAITTDSAGGNERLRFNVNQMVGATSTSAGTAGVVPAPQAGDDTKFLSGAGTFAAASSVLEVQVFS